jgi:hypothetical protein
MKTNLDSESFKIWFHTGTSRNIHNVVEINHNENLMCIKTADGSEYLVNFSRVTLIEQI